MDKRLWSVFTDDMDHCYFTGYPGVERHHIFGSSRKEASEKRGFIIPLRPDLHPNGASFKRTKENEKNRRYAEKDGPGILRGQLRQQRRIPEGIWKKLPLNG